MSERSMRSMFLDPPQPRQREPASRVVATVEKLEEQQERAMKDATAWSAGIFDACCARFPGGATRLAALSGASEGDISKMRSGERPVQHRLYYFLDGDPDTAMLHLALESSHAGLAMPKRRRKVTQRQVADALLAFAREKGLFDVLRQETANRLGVTVSDLDVALDPTAEEVRRPSEDDDA